VGLDLGSSRQNGEKKRAWGRMWRVATVWMRSRRRESKWSVVLLSWVSQDLGATFFAKENNIFWAFLLLAFMASKLFTKTRVLVFSEEYNILLTFVLQK
jgi:hypothetical protein